MKRTHAMGAAIVLLAQAACGSSPSLGTGAAAGSSGGGAPMGRGGSSPGPGAGGAGGGAGQPGTGGGGSAGAGSGRSDSGGGLPDARPDMMAVLDATAGQDGTSADLGGPAAGYDPAAYETVCAKAVMYKNDLTHPRARQLHTDVGGDGNARLRQMIRSVCAVLWRTPNEVPQRYRKGQSVVLNLSDTKWPATTGAFVLSFDSAFFNESWPNHTDEVLGRTSHEVGHIHYFYPGEPAPAWVVEGMLDFVRLKLGHINRQDIMGARRSHYCSSYKPAGLLFEWLESRHPGFVHKFNLWIEANRTRPWPGTSSIVSELTGMSLETHWQDYTRNYNVSPPAMSCN